MTEMPDLDLSGDADVDAAFPGAAAAGDGTPENGAVASAEGDDEAVEPVELLVGLAEEGEIDPWDIDIVETTDAFLERLDDADLRTSGRALFYASVLLRMKGDELLSEDEEADPEPEPWEVAMTGGDDPPDHDPVDALETEMERRLDRKHARGSPETLDELVRELREAERDSWWKESREYDTSDSPRGFARGTQTVDYRAPDEMRDATEPTERDVTGTTHGEDMDATVGAVREALSVHYEAGREEVLFAEVREAGGRAVMTYLALLFLAHRGAVRLRQDELFGDLWVQDVATSGAAEGALAD
jgi:segregation and condensation protein A